MKCTPVQSLSICGVLLPILKCVYINISSSPSSGVGHLLTLTSVCPSTSNSVPIFKTLVVDLNKEICLKKLQELINDLREKIYISISEFFIICARSSLITTGFENPLDLLLTSETVIINCFSPTCFTLFSFSNKIASGTLLPFSIASFSCFFHSLF